MSTVQQLTPKHHNDLPSRALLKNRDMCTSPSKTLYLAKFHKQMNKEREILWSIRAWEMKTCKDIVNSSLVEEICKVQDGGWFSKKVEGWNWMGKAIFKSKIGGYSRASFGYF
jgi:hypothetical protein